MKVFKKLIVMSLITVVVIFSAFFYINKYILSTTSIKIQSKKVTTANINPTVAVKIPTAAENLKASYDGNYIAYDNNGLNIIDTSSGLNKVLELEASGAFFTWLPDRNRILIVETSKKNYKKTFKLDYYDADRDEIGNIIEFNAFDRTAKIKDLKISTITNSIYIKVEDGNGKIKIYYLNIMKKLKKVKTRVTNVGNIEVIPNKSSMVYEDVTHGRIYVTNLKKPLTFNNMVPKSLLGMDNEDNIYIGERIAGKISKIYYGSLDENNITWGSYILKSPVDKEDIYVTKAGAIYVNEVQNEKLFNVKTTEYTNYKGILLEITSDSIISIYQQRLILTKLK